MYAINRTLLLSQEVFQKHNIQSYAFHPSPGLVSEHLFWCDGWILSSKTEMGFLQIFPITRYSCGSTEGPRLVEGRQRTSASHWEKINRNFLGFPHRKIVLKTINSNAWKSLESNVPRANKQNKSIKIVLNPKLYFNPPLFEPKKQM